MSNKSKNIQHYSHQLEVIGEHIEKTEKISKLPFTSIHIYNASNEKNEITIPEELKKLLKEFLLNYYYQRQEEVFNKLGKEVGITK